MDDLKFSYGDILRISSYFRQIKVDQFMIDVISKYGVFNFTNGIRFIQDEMEKPKLKSGYRTEYHNIKKSLLFYKAKTKKD